MKYASKREAARTCKWGKEHVYEERAQRGRPSYIGEYCTGCGKAKKGSMRRKPRQDVSAWPGPFTPRTDRPNLKRPAMWVICTYCHGLFPIAVSHAKTDTHHHRGVQTFCSRECKDKGQLRNKGVRRVPLIARECIVCHKTYLPPKNSSKQVHCSVKCGTFTQSQKAAAWASRAVTNYLSSRGLTRETMVCEYCGTKELLSIGRKNGDFKDMRPGNLTVWCRRCQYHKRHGKVLERVVPRW